MNPTPQRGSCLSNPKSWRAWRQRQEPPLAIAKVKRKGKGRIVVAILLFAATTGRAQVSESERFLRERRIAIATKANVDRWRVIDGVLVDLKPFFDYSGKAGPPPGFDGWQYLYGEVAGITAGVMLFQPTFPMAQGWEYAIIKNHPLQKSAVIGNRLRFFARRNGTYQRDDVFASLKLSSLPLYDYGSKPAGELEKKVSEIESREKTETDARLEGLGQAVDLQRESKRSETEQKVIAFQMERASNGSAQAQFDLGMRYLHGEGLGSNLDFARRWLNAAATNGNASASNALKLLKEPK